MAETKQQAIEEAKENFVADLNRICDWIRGECNYLKGKEFNDEYNFLYYKAFVLSGLLIRLPLGLDHCPFCIENLVYDDIGDRLPDCSKCTYATTHEACQDDNSIYKILSNSKKLVQRILSNLYATKEPTQDDISQIIWLVDKIRSQLEYWEYRKLLRKKRKGLAGSGKRQGGIGMPQALSQAENFNKKIFSRKVKDIDKVHVTKGKFLAYNYIGDRGDGARAILVEQDKNKPDKVYVEVAKIIPMERWITEYYIELDQEDGAIINQTEKADFMTFDYDYTACDDELNLELRFWFDYQEVVVLEVNLWSQSSKLNKEE